jgi:signal transduction histidine kinase
MKGGNMTKQYAPIAAEPAMIKKADYEHAETRELVDLVTDAEDLMHIKGEAAFVEFRDPESHWRQGENYIFVLDTNGNMIVHADVNLEGKNQLDLKDVNGKGIIRGLIDAVATVDGKTEGWYHYQWPVPGALIPRWKSSFVRLVKAPSGKSYIVGSGMYNDRMEREFVVDMVRNAVEIVEKNAEKSFSIFRDVTSSFMAKDAYIFVIDPNGVELVNPAFPNLEGRNLLDLKDTSGKSLVREMFKVVQTDGFGWVDYMWPKPGDSVSTQKSTYVSKAKFGKDWVIVGCGVYLADAPKTISTIKKMTAHDLITLVREAATVFEKVGEKAYEEFNTQGTKWYHDETYFFVWTMDGIRAFNGPEPEKEGADLSQSKDILGRPIGQMLLDAGRSISGEGWLHYMYIVPGEIFPKWKSSFVKRVTFPSGKQHVIGSGIYNMQMNKSFIEDVVNRAAELVEHRGKESFNLLRDKRGPFVFMDIYVFVETPDGIELVNPAQPSLEGKNLVDFKDLKGKAVVRDEIAAAMTDESAWLECYWYQPGDNKPALKQTYVRKVRHGSETYIVGSGLYGEEGPVIGGEVQKILWSASKAEKLSDRLSRQMVSGKKATMARLSMKNGATVARHYHVNEEYVMVISGSLKYVFDDREVMISTDETLVVPSNIPHSITALEDTSFVIFFAPVREDWLRGEDKYLRQ